MSFIIKNLTDEEFFNLPEGSTINICSDNLVYFYNKLPSESFAFRDKKVVFKQLSSFTWETKRKTRVKLMWSSIQVTLLGKPNPRKVKP